MGRYIAQQRMKNPWVTVVELLGWIASGLGVLAYLITHHLHALGLFGGIHENVAFSAFVMSWLFSLVSWFTLWLCCTGLCSLCPLVCLGTLGGPNGYDCVQPGSFLRPLWLQGRTPAVSCRNHIPWQGAVEELLHDPQASFSSGLVVHMVPHISIRYVFLIVLHVILSFGFSNIFSMAKIIITIIHCSFDWTSNY